MAYPMCQDTRDNVSLMAINVIGIVGCEVDYYFLRHLVPPTPPILIEMKDSK